MIERKIRAEIAFRDIIMNDFEYEDAAMPYSSGVSTDVIGVEQVRKSHERELMAIEGLKE